MNDTLQSAWQAQGFEAQTPIQLQTYQPLLEGTNIQGLAPTGTGKTLAFSLPIIEKMTAGAGLQLMVLVSSQELAHQMQQALLPFTKASDLTTAVITGNANVKRQIEHLKAKPEIIIATIGRLMELLNKGKVKVKPLKTLILDEADALLSENGGEKLDMLFEHLPKPLQVCCFGATTSSAVDKFAKAHGLNLTTIDVRAHLVATNQVSHLFLQTTPRGKAVILKSLSKHKDFYGMVFFRQKNQLITTAHTLEDWHVPVAVLDGRKDSTTRQNALQAFRQHKIRLLLASDVAARGLDITDLTTVINFDIPETKTAYVHRSGRTGRMGKGGQVLSLGNDHDRRDLRHLLGPDVPVQTVYLTAEGLTKEAPKRAKTSAQPTPKSKTSTPAKKRFKKNKHDKQRKNKGKPRSKKE